MAAASTTDAVAAGEASPASKTQYDALSRTLVQVRRLQRSFSGQLPILVASSPFPIAVGNFY